MPQNVVAKIDPKTGEKTINPASIPHIGQTTVNCPADPGGRGWPATAYSPKTGTLYLPLNEYCSDTTPQPLNPGEAYTGGGRAVYARRLVPGSDTNVGRVDAIKLADQSTTWSYRTRAPQTGAVLPTGGGLVFSGTWDRWFRALDDSTGQVLWQMRLNNAINAFPITYYRWRQTVRRNRGRQRSRDRGEVARRRMTPGDQNPDGGSSLWVFALPSN